MSVRTVLLGFAAMMVVVFAPDDALWWLPLHVTAGFVMGGIIARAAKYDTLEGA